MCIYDIYGCKGLKHEGLCSAVQLENEWEIKAKAAVTTITRENMEFRSYPCRM